ncbi:TenA family protein [Leifsonia sp. L25]|uniref:TenA family protein n=1 Tax=Actinomycetes TaxID=1760 RepID=UPI003D687FDB
MTFTGQAWQDIRPIRDAIDAHPFLQGLEDGTLPREAFTHYLAQDAAYLGAHSKVLAAAASRTHDPDALAFWSHSAANAIAVERQLHESHGVDAATVEASPTCTAYTSYLLALTATSSYPVIVAAVLPCFWIYDDVGRRLAERLVDLGAHPYGDWIGTYGDPAFAAATATARCLVDDAAQSAAPADVARMRQAFATASRYEWMFWDAAWRREEWPV